MPYVWVDDESGGHSEWVDDGSAPSSDFWQMIGIQPDTTMENWQSPSNAQIEEAISLNPAWSDLLSKYGSKALNLLKDNKGNYDLAKLATVAAGAYSLSNAGGGGGYNRPVPKMEMVREQVAQPAQSGLAGVYGRKYFTDPRFVAQGDTAALEAAKAASAEQAAGLRALPPAAPAANPYAGKMNLAALTPAARPPVQAAPAAQIPQIPQPGQAMAHGGISELAKGGRYLAGSTDGMEDKINTTIDNQEPAKLSHGEFVIPADVVSHLGNGNSEAGAKKLYEMMARVRKARTGNPEQGKQINPNRFMPGGMAYANGGEVKRFDGTTGSQVTSSGTTGTATGAAGLPLDRSTASTLSPWAGEYVTNALGQGAALAAAPYQAYTGQLTAGPSNLQQQAFAGASEMAQTGYTPTQFTTGTFDAGAVGQYMNPYLKSALDPQLAELKRQADIKRMEDASRLTKAGAYGGSRQAIMESEGARNLLEAQRRALGEGYATAYDKAMAQFNAQQQREMEAQKASEASRQFGGEFGLKSLDYLSNLGKTQRDIEQEGLTAQQRQFEEQRDWAYKMPQYQLNLLQGIPVGGTTTSTDQTGLNALMSNISGLGSLYQQLARLGQTSTTPTTTG